MDEQEIQKIINIKGGDARSMTNTNTSRLFAIFQYWPL